VGVALVGLASAVASLCIAAFLGLLSSSWSSVRLSSVIHEHWAYGRWILGASIANGVANGLYVPLVGVLVGLDQTAVLRVLQNLILPLQQVLTGITLVAYPSMSRRVAERGTSHLRHRGPAFLLVGIGLAVLYGVAISVFAYPLLSLLYGRGHYAAYSGLTPLVAVVGIGAAVAQFLSILVRAIDQPRVVLWSKLVGAGWLAIAGIPLVRTSGVRGALLSLIGGSFVEALVLGFALTRGLTSLPLTAPE
jgi:O-antigen/teichoic acid export membrane protein